MSDDGHSGAGGALAVCACMGHLTINSVLMHTPAWCVLDLIQLWLPPKIRGTNLLIPRVVGTRPRPVRITETDYSLPMAISGAVDQDGIVDPDGVLMCLYRNLQYLQTNVTDPPTPPTATVPASLELPNGDVLTAEIQVLGITVSDHVKMLTNAVLDIRIPAGRFV